MKAFEDKKALEQAGVIAAYEKRKEYERIEQEEMSRQIQYLVQENQRLREGFEVMVYDKGIAERFKEDAEGKQGRHVKKLLEENLPLRSRLHHVTSQVGGKQDEADATFATPNGSVPSRMILPWLMRIVRREGEEKEKVQRETSQRPIPFHLRPWM